MATRVTRDCVNSDLNKNKETEIKEAAMFVRLLNANAPDFGKLFS